MNSITVRISWDEPENHFLSPPRIERLLRVHYQSNSIKVEEVLDIQERDGSLLIKCANPKCENRFMSSKPDILCPPCRAEVKQGKRRRQHHEEETEEKFGGVVL